MHTINSRYVALGLAVLALFGALPLRANDPKGSGTAFVVHPDGYLLTCWHVVKDSRQLQVVIDGKTYEALLIDADDKHDLALIQVQATGLTMLPLGDSDTVQVGEDATTCGFPLAPVLGDSIKITRGTISGVETRNGIKLFQIDAAVNEGNSGGPLVNDRGEVIGIVNAKMSGFNISNIGFAVPINFAKRLLREQGVPMGRPASLPKLDGPTLVKHASPAVAILNVGKTPTSPRPAPITPATPLPQAQQIAKTLADYKHLVAALAFSPDGKALATAGDDAVVGLWNAQTGELYRPLIVHRGVVTALAFSGDGKLLVTGSLDQTLQFWDPFKGELKKTLGMQMGQVVALALSREATTLIAATGPPGKPGTIRIWDVASGKIRRTMAGHASEITSVAVSPDGNFFASGGKDFTVRLWDGNGKLFRVLKDHFDQVNTVAFSPDSKLLASAGKDMTIRIWDTATGTLQHTLTGHRDEINALTFTPDGKSLASASQDNTVKFWNPDTGDLQTTVAAEGSGGVSALAFTPNGKLLALATKDKTVKLVDVAEIKR